MRFMSADTSSPEACDITFESPYSVHVLGVRLREGHGLPADEFPVEPDNPLSIDVLGRNVVDFIIGAPHDGEGEAVTVDERGVHWLFC